MFDRTEPVVVLLRASLVAAGLALPMWSQAGSPAGVSADDWRSIRSAIDEHRHAAIEVDAGYRAHNPGQAWDIAFDRRGFSVEPMTRDWTWGLELVSFGFAGEEISVEGKANSIADGGRVTNIWSETLEEWYINDRNGLEHGFTVNRRPGLEHELAPGALTLTLRVRGTLRPVVQVDGRGVRFLMENGTTALRYTGLTVFDADGRDLPARIEECPAGLKLSVDERGARYPITIDPIAQEAYLKASASDDLDRFGLSVAASGNTIVVGAPGESSDATGINGDDSNNNTLGTGAVYVFVRNGSNWSHEAYIKASTADIADAFGQSVAISGNTLVVGAPFEDSSAFGVNGDQSNNGDKNSGAAFVFVRSGSTWTQQAYLKAWSTNKPFSTGVLFGSSLAVSGDTIIVGAPAEASDTVGINGAPDNANAANAGAAFVFVRSGTTWTKEAYLKASNTGTGDKFGTSVAVSVDTIIVGALNEDSDATGVNGDDSNDNSAQSGAAYVFARSGTTWSQQAYLKASNAENFDLFGTIVDVSRERVIVSAPEEDSNTTGVDGDQSDNSSIESGAAYVFVRNGTTWTQEAYLKAFNTDPGDKFGLAAAISGDTLIVGAPGEASDATGINGDQGNIFGCCRGAAYTYIRSGFTWLQNDYMKASSTGQKVFGASVAISTQDVVVGAWSEDSNATGVNGDESDTSSFNAGAAYAFRIPSALSGDSTTLSLSSGGQHVMTLDAATARANWFFFILGSATGTTPGIDFGGGLILPLNFDGYMSLILHKHGLAAFSNFLGQLDGSGTDQAMLILPPGVDPTLAGVTFNHAYLAAEVFGISDFVSNPVSVTLVP